LVLHPEFNQVLESSIAEAKRLGLLKGSKLRAAVDTKPILSRGAVQDTYNLLGTGMKQLARALSRQATQSLEEFLAEHDLSELTESSLKGAADLDWSNEAQRRDFLNRLVTKARALLKLAGEGDEAVRDASDLLAKLLVQDVEEPSDGGQARLKQGTAPGRIPAATDPQQRHGRKSKSKRFVGSKVSIAVEVESGVVLATQIIPGDAGDATGVVELIEQAENNAQAEITETIGDCAYGSGATRQEFADAGREMIAKVPATPTGGAMFPKSAFTIELPEAGRDLGLTKVTCPGGFVAGRAIREANQGVTFFFDDHCTGCPLRAQCTKAAQGRSISIHPQEHLIQEARAFQATPEGRAKLRKRLVVENSLARLGHLGIGQAKYIGHAKARFQLELTAAVANFRRTWNWAADQTRQPAAAPCLIAG
jgi:hypothetical protein